MPRPQKIWYWEARKVMRPEFSGWGIARLHGIIGR